jgi:hypothetical protein
MNDTRRSSRAPSSGLLPLALLSLAAPLGAQEAIQTDAATQPSVGTFVVRQQVRFTSYKNDPALHENIDSEWESRTSLSYGITPNLSITASLPLLLRDRLVGPATPPERETTTFGVGDIPVMLKYRVYRSDTSPVDTIRFSLMGGAELPSFDRPFSSESVDPIIGAVLTTIRGRHGFNQAVQYKFNTGGAVHSHPHDRRYGMAPGDGPADALFYDSAYLFRIAPTEYAVDTFAATYAVLELNGVYETNGDNEILLSPGLLYEARTWAGEISFQFPIVQDVDRRPEVRYSIVAGLRFLF